MAINFFHFNGNKFPSVSTDHLTQSEEYLWYNENDINKN